MSQSARLKKTGPQEIGARLGTLSKANRETVEVSVNATNMLNFQKEILYYKLLTTLVHFYYLVIVVLPTFVLCSTN